jgi:hypothetical protein
MTPFLSPEILDFIEANIDSVPQLETLLLLREEPGSALDEVAVAARIYAALDVAREILETLRRRGLVVAEGNPPQYRYAPPDAVWQLFDQVVLAYRHHLVSVTTFIHSKPRTSTRAFDLKSES